MKLWRRDYQKNIVSYMVYVFKGSEGTFWDIIVGGSCACAYRGLWRTVSVVAEFFSIGSSLCRADNTN